MRLIQKSNLLVYDTRGYFARCVLICPNPKRAHFLVFGLLVFEIHPRGGGGVLCKFLGGDVPLGL